MDLKTFFRKYWFILLFLVTLLVPVYGKLLDSRVNLSGVTASAEPAELSIGGLADGSTQAELNSRWEENFPGKKALIKVRNQILYSCLKTSPNQNVVIGKENYLFEPDYIYAQLMANVPYEQEYYTQLESKLEALKGLLEENGKELYVFITPSKARFFTEKIPNTYMLLDRREEYDWNEYGKLLSILEESGIPCFDSIRFLEENRESGLLESPYFFATGSHWSESWGKMSSAQFLAMMRQHSRFDLGSISVTESVSPEPVAPETDLYDSLNLLRRPTDTWYRADVALAEEGTDHPGVFMQGGSFMGQSLSQLIWIGLFGSDIYYENYYYYTDRFNSYGLTSGFGAYDEADIDRYMGQADILILEVNEAAIDRMSFGFIDYLLEHPEYTDRQFDTQTGGEG